MSRIATLTVGSFEHPLVAAVATAGGSVRRGCWVRLETTEGLVGLGEASPAEWVGGEPLAVTRRDLAALSSEAAGSRTEDLRVAVRPLSPAAGCAVECAIVDVEARRRGISAARFLGAPGDLSQPVAALLDGAGPDEIMRSARRAVGRGHACVKLKIGSRSPAAEAARVAAARRGAGSGAALRLDANRALESDAAGELLERVRPFGVAFVEEPLANPTRSELERLRRLGIPIALDESIVSSQDVDRFDGAFDVVVLKLARVGGFTRALALARRAVSSGLGVVVTDSIETSIGRAAALHAAAAVTAIVGADGARPVGLGGAFRLAGDLASPSVPWMPALGIVAGPGLGLVWREDGR